MIEETCIVAVPRRAVTLQSTTSPLETRVLAGVVRHRRAVVQSDVDGGDLVGDFVEFINSHYKASALRVKRDVIYVSCVVASKLRNQRQKMASQNTVI